MLTILVVDFDSKLIEYKINLNVPNLKLFNARIKVSLLRFVRSVYFNIPARESKQSLRNNVVVLHSKSTEALVILAELKSCSERVRSSS